MKRKYFFFDIDGTLTSSKVHSMIPDSTREALRALKKQGHFIAIATGRPIYFAHDFAKDIQIANLVCNGGNDVYIDDACVYHEPFDRELALRVIDTCKEHKLSFCVSTENSRLRITDSDQFVADLKGQRFMGDVKVIPHFDFHQVAQVERIFIAVEKEVEDTIPLFQEHRSARYHDAYTIMEPDDKYIGILKMMEILRAPLEDVVVFGDGINDMKMFQQAPFSIAMGNGAPELQSLADYVTDTSDHDGIKKALEYFHWM